MSQRSRSAEALAVTLTHVARHDPPPRRWYTVIRALVGAVVARYRARRRHVDADQEARQAWAEFTTPGGDWLARWEALVLLAACEQTMAETAFGFRWAADRDEDGFTLAQSHTGASELLSLIAATELSTMARADQPWYPQRTLGDIDGPDLDTDPAVAAVLARLVAETDPARRAELTMALYNAVVGRVGGQAAEVLPWLAHGYYQLAGLSPQQAWRRVWEHPADGGAGHE